MLGERGQRLGGPDFSENVCSNLESTLSMIGNVSSNIDILILQGENDTATPVEQGLLLQQRLTEVNHPDLLCTIV